jgi:hypothetical protein
MLRYALVSILLLCVTRLAAAVSLVNVVDEQCPLVISVQDMPALIKSWNESPWAKTWNDEQMKKFLAPFRSQIKVDKWDEQCRAETGYNVSELLGMAQGQVLLAVTSMDLPFEEANPDPSQFPIFLAIEVGSNASKVAKIIADNDEKEHATVKVEDFGGVKLHIYQKSGEKSGEEFIWAMVDGVWVLGPSKATVQKAVDALQKGRVASPLGESERYLKIRKQSPDANLSLLVNFQSMYPSLKALAEKKSAQGGNQPMGLSPTVVMDAMGLNTLQDFYFTVEMGDAATNLNGGITYSEARGIMKLIAYRDGPLAQPSFVSEKWIAAGTMAFSIPGLYAGVRELMDSLNPALGGMLQMQIKNLNQQLGVDLERDLIGSMGESIVVGTAMRPGANPDTPTPLNELDQLYSISLLNAPAFTKSVEALKGMMGPQAEKMFTKREYLGQTIYSYAAVKPGQLGFNYAVTPKYLFVSAGSPAVIETALQGLDGKQPTLWQKPEVKAAFADVPAKACAFQYQNTKAMVGSFIEMLVKLAPMFANNQPKPAATEDSEEGAEAPPAATENASPVDLSAKPDAAVIAKYWSYSTGRVERDSHGLYFQSKINHVK